MIGTTIIWSLFYAVGTLGYLRSILKRKKFTLKIAMGLLVWLLFGLCVLVVALLMSK